LSETEKATSVSGDDHKDEGAESQRWYLERTEELEASNKELESFTYSVSHDLRSPLRSILGYAKILQEDYGHVLDEEGRMILGRQIDAAQRMERLISDLLDYSRLGRREILPADFDISRLAREVAEEVTRRSRNYPVYFDIEDGLRAYADPSLMRFVLQNLFENAVKYSAPKGKAEVEFGQEPDQSYFVRDHGIGFEMKYVDNLFKPFERLHNASQFPGTGIGLTNVQRVVLRHGGKVWAESTLDEGATFHFSLPSQP